MPQAKTTKDEPLNAWGANQETEQLKGVIDAAARFPRWSASYCLLFPMRHVYHFDSKAEAEAYRRETYPELWKKTSISQAGFFLSSFVSNPIFQPEIPEYGVVQLLRNLNSVVRLPFIAAEKDPRTLIKALMQESPRKHLISYREWSTLQEALGHLPKPLASQLRLWAYRTEFKYEGQVDPTIIHRKDLDFPPRLDSAPNYFRKQGWSQLPRAEQKLGERLLYNGKEWFGFLCFTVLFTSNYFISGSPSTD
ncbi:hypothetical protein Asppvi_005704 [Aspergillus pseudoviridinutans]|uniref:Uncharacterized protein n=1 Tax=Aspergillus pseudoviridinutans TaxID=1517512 RepID=A0A9P3BEF2_9EURO|nr:uncharacterized protein Asppvi_005704 [Aspergillus pseudoviridinutans]GIJ86808.1 hypothetical protein Asppvi_005704 [Aspergillus pseudoviridinutans]